MGSPNSDHYYLWATLEGIAKRMKLDSLTVGHHIAMYPPGSADSFPKPSSIRDGQRIWPLVAVDDWYTRRALSRKDVFKHV